MSEANETLFVKVEKKPINRMRMVTKPISAIKESSSSNNTQHGQKPTDGIEELSQNVAKADLQEADKSNDFKAGCTEEIFKFRTSSVLKEGKSMDPSGFRPTNLLNNKILGDTTDTDKSSISNKRSSFSMFMKDMQGDFRPIYRNDGQRVYRLGEENSSSARSGKNVQDFKSLRDQCLAEGKLFEDPDFPPNDSSLYFNKNPGKCFKWLRPREIVSNPQLFVEGFDRFDVQQGELGDCWLLAALANLTLHKKLFYQIVPDDQGFDEKYAGIFHFRFWRYGNWVDVVVDDRLPTYNGELVFLRSPDQNEFWSALLEKAYAKLHGSYEALDGGTTCEAMEDFTGGVTEMYTMNEAPPNLYTILLHGYRRGSLMGCNIDSDPNELEAKTHVGLIKGHAYSITKVCYVDVKTPRKQGKVPLLRLRNPWGNEAEWNGPWSDKSPEWTCIPNSTKKEIGLTFDNDGEFWMSYKDFSEHFTRLEICNLNPDSLDSHEAPEGFGKRWDTKVFHGEWVQGVTAGGCGNNSKTFSQNHQYSLTLTDPDEDDDQDLCTIIVGLMQKNRRSQRLVGLDCLYIGFVIYEQNPHGQKTLSLDSFKPNGFVPGSPPFMNSRDVSCRFKLRPGTYCIIPSTYDANEEGEFLLRIFTETSSTAVSFN